MGVDPEIYVTCGTSGGRIINGEVKNMIGSLYYKKCCPNIKIPEPKTHCVCGIKIIENCYVTTPDYNPDNIIVVGNCCFKEFFKNKVTYCLVCNEPHTNGIFDNKGLCDNCKVVKRAKLREISKEMTLLLKEHESSLNDIVQKQHNEYNNICSLHDQSIQKAIYYDKLRKEGKLENYLAKEKEKELIEQSNILLDDYREALQVELNMLNNVYKIRFNKFEVFNRFNKLSNRNKILKCICNDTYKIACIYIDSKHVYTINLNTLQPTNNSPNLISIY